MTPPGLAAYLLFSRIGPWLVGDRVIKRRGRDLDPKIADKNEWMGISTTPRPDGELIWFHASNVGEALSVNELVRRLYDEDDSLQFLITTRSNAAYQAIESKKNDATIHQVLPLDFTKFAQRFLDHWKPDLSVWTESALWPAFLHQLGKRKIPVVLLNGRMSRKKFRKWIVFRSSAGRLFETFRGMHIQDEASAESFRWLGAPDARLSVTGTLREGSSALPYVEAQREEISKAAERRTVWLAASTTQNEEQIVANAHREVLRRGPRTLLIIVPRDPIRGPSVAADLRGQGWRVALRSQKQSLLQDTEIYIADTLNELGLWYRIATISFLGGSLTQLGGANPFEPAALGSAILQGPNVGEFREISDRLFEAKASRSVKNAETLADAVITLLAPDEVAEMAHAAWEVCSSGAEVIDQAVDLLLDSIGAVE